MLKIVKQYLRHYWTHEQTLRFVGDKESGVIVDLNRGRLCAYVWPDSPVKYNVLVCVSLIKAWRLKFLTDAEYPDDQTVSTLLGPTLRRTPVGRSSTDSGAGGRLYGQVKWKTPVGKTGGGFSLFEDENI